MTQQNEDKRGLFYSHVSRLYNSSVNVLTAIVFGWAAFIGLALNLIYNSAFDLARLLPIIFFVGVVIIIMASYNFYFRVLHFGRMIYQLEKDLELVSYIERLKLLPGVARLVSRRDTNAWASAEWVTAIILALYFIAPFLYLIFLVLGHS